MIPVEVLISDACRTLPHFAVRVLIAFAAQFRGMNNGDLSLTWKTARPFGINSKWQLIDGIALLLDHMLIVKTRQGGKKPLGPCLYAVTWHAIDECKGKQLEVAPSFRPSDAWAKWKAVAPSTEIQQHLRGTASAPPEDLKTSISAPPGDRTTPFLGTSGGAPSRSWPGGHALTVLKGGVQ